MISEMKDNWCNANQHYLVTALSTVKYALERYATLHNGNTRSEPKSKFSIASFWERQSDDNEQPPIKRNDPQKNLNESRLEMSAPPALEILSNAFSLSPFEQSILLMCAGIELDSSFAQLYANAQGDPRKAYPTFGLAMAALPNPHWSAIVPTAPIRHWRMVEITNEDALMASPVRIDERILHFLAGVQYQDERLSGVIRPLRGRSDLVPSHEIIAEKIAEIWSKEISSGMPVIQLSGSSVEDRHSIAIDACSRLGLNLNILSASIIQPDASDLNLLMRLWEREAILNGGALLIEYDSTGAADPARTGSVLRLIEGLGGALILSSEEPKALVRRAFSFQVEKPSAKEQFNLWENTLGGSAARDCDLKEIISEFDLDAHSIMNIASDIIASGIIAVKAEPTEDQCGQLWNACKARARPKLDDLAERIESSATWDDLVLPELQLGILHELASQVRQRARVYQDWGFEAKCSRGLGISALFVGPSGTGKTLAAEVLAGELGQDLYRIDLSSVVSKYIGETEKNLRRIFDAAEGGGAILLFDEADALFGKRSEVKDSHDRYANIEISYLLQRMEAYRGLAILTTNMKGLLDTAFLRRIRFIVQFPFPNASQRAEIWSRIFPKETPLGKIETFKLSRLNISGGSIRNIALNAAFLAAEEDGVVQMGHILRAARIEYAKMEKPLTDAETAGWA